MRIVNAVIDGATFREAGEMVGLSGARTAQNFYKACDELGISRDIQLLRENPTAAKDALRKRISTPTISLPEQVLRRLLAPSGYRMDELTLDELSKRPGKEVLRKFGPAVLLEVQKWLATHGRSMRTSEASTPNELSDIEQAVAILRVYGIHIDVSRSQMPLWERRE